MDGNVSMDNSGDLQVFYESVGQDVDRAAAQCRPVRSVPDPIESSQSSQNGPARAWAINGDRYCGITQSLDTLPPGCYRAHAADDVGVYLALQPLRADTILTLPDSKSELVVEEIERFTTMRPEFTKRGLLFKRGLLLWGPPGSGKTSTLHLLMRLIVDRLGGIALLVEHPGLAGSALQLVRRIEPDRQIIAIMEDMDGLVENYGVESYLSLLDGESQIDNVVFVATTNYPERLDRRFVDRPSRFDSVEYVGMPSPEARRAYFVHKEPLLPTVFIDDMVEATEGLSIAHLREMIILTQCFGQTIAQATARLTAFRHRKPSSDRDPEHAPAGFTGTMIKIGQETMLIQPHARRPHPSRG